MGVDFSIVVYTHTDMQDVWPMFFGQFKKYVQNKKVYVAVNQTHDDIPSEYTQLIYDDSKTYTERWVKILPQIKEEVVLFLHEDMILYNTPLFDEIERYSKYVNEGKADSIKMILAGDTFSECEFDSTLVLNDYSKFSIQPTIIKSSLFLKLVELTGPLDIWNFEKSIISNNRDFMVRYGNEKKRGMHHYDSLIFPYIATAITKGRWNYSEYKNELDELFKEYSIDPYKRGIV